jgi:pseudaminic acid synthase
VILATGIAYLEDIERAVRVCGEEGNEQVMILKCTSAYPTPYEDMNLKVIPNMRETFDCIVGLSDHSAGSAAAVGGVALGAAMVEKHFTLSRKDGGPDGAFSMEPDEFKRMAEDIRAVERALGKATYELTAQQEKSREDGRSLFVAEPIKAGEELTERNVRSVRPAFGLHTMYYEEILGKRAKMDLEKGMPLAWRHID